MAREAPRTHPTLLVIFLQLPGNMIAIKAKGRRAEPGREHVWVEGAREGRRRGEGGKTREKDGEGTPRGHVHGCAHAVAPPPRPQFCMLPPGVAVL